MQKYLDISFDDIFDLSGMINSRLSWYPWIGKNYKNAEEKLLIIGESHYTIEQELNAILDDINQIMDNPNFTREVIYRMPICGENPTIFFKNIHKLFNTSPTDTYKLWQEISFYNFIQRPLEYKNKERPMYEDYFNYWETFLHVASTIKPDTCLFIGVGASTAFEDAMKSAKVDYTPITTEQKINRTFARSATVTINGKVITLNFTLHASRMFSPLLWREYLNTKLPNVFTYLENKVNNFKQN